MRALGYFSTLFFALFLSLYAEPVFGQRPNCARKNEYGAGLQLGFPVHAVDPAVPRKVRKKGFVVVLSGTMTASGNFENLTFETGSAEFTDAAVNAVRQWRYTAPLENGQPTEIRVYIIIQSAQHGFNYTIDEDPSFPTRPQQDVNQQISEGTLFRSEDAGIRPPQAIYAPDPQYSEAARVLKYSANVELGVIVGADGNPKDVWVTKQAGLGLDQKSVETIGKWKFRPGTKDGLAVPVLINIQTSFHVY